MAAEETIEQWQQIVDEFSQHQTEVEETFLDLCHYKGERFEEICSRVLKFFFDPNEKHGFRDLWFRALCEIFDKNYDGNNYGVSEMKIKLEEPTSEAKDSQRKKIDIILKLPKLVITIENKINAPSNYNPYNTYTEHVQSKYSGDKKFIVLIARKLNTEERKNDTETKIFEVINYNDLFKNVESLLGEYVAKCNQKYLTHMLDFIQTVKNRVTKMELTDFENKFFAQNKKTLDVMFSKYQQLQRDVSKQIEELRTQLNKEQKFNNNWEHNPTWNLCVIFLKKTKEQIGIVSNFEFDNETYNPFGIFRIYITTWNEKCWEESYKKIDSLRNHPDVCLIDIVENNKGNRVYLHMHPIERKNFETEKAYIDEITKKLSEYYNFLKGLTENQESTAPENTGATS